MIEIRRRSKAHGSRRAEASGPSWILWAAVAMILTQLGLRAWAISHSWFRVDDLEILGRLNAEGFSWSTAFEPWAGHLVAFNWVLPWLTMQVADPLNFTVPALSVLALTTLANAGCLVFLLTAFGRRPGILVPLAVFLFSTIGLPSFMWLTSATNKTPVLAAMFWGAAAHLCYLRTRKYRWAVITMLITLAGLFCFEKALYVWVVYAVLALGYFATGDIIERAQQVFRTYRFGVLLYSVTIVGFLAAYMTHFLDFNPTETGRAPVMPLAWNAALSNASGLVGGPFAWDFSEVTEGLATPGEALGLLSMAVIAVLIYELARARERSKRAWIIPAVFFTADVVLLAGTRVDLSTPEQVGSMFRYFTEMSAGAAIALGLASMPLRGAVESSERREGYTSAFLDRPWRVVAATAAMSLLATISLVTFVDGRRADTAVEDFYSTMRASAAEIEGTFQVLDVPVPPWVLWGPAYPYNLASYQVPLVTDRAEFPGIATNSLLKLSETGEFAPVGVNAVRQWNGDYKAACVDDVTGSIAVTLDGPVFGFGWLARVEYVAQSASPVHVEAGDSNYDTMLEVGFHSMFFTVTGDNFDQITLSGIDPGTKVCVTKVVVGTPTAIQADQ